jgi:hypothetical protein
MGSKRRHTFHSGRLEDIMLSDIERGEDISGPRLDTRTAHGLHPFLNESDVDGFTREQLAQLDRSSRRRSD